MSLLDGDVIAGTLTHDAPWCESHGAGGDYLGAGLIYYTLVYAMRAELAVCLGSGGGFVPRLMRQAQRDAGIAERSRTVLVDGILPEAGWGSPQWLDPHSSFRAQFPDVEIVLQRTDEAAHVFATEQAEIDYLHIDADHSQAGCLEDFLRYCPFLRPRSLVTLHDTNLTGAGVKYVLEQLRARADCELIDLVDAGTGVALLRITAEDPRPRTVLGQEAAVTITRRPDPPRLEPPMLQWRYLRSEAFSVRNVLAAHFVRDCPTVIEIGGWQTPIDRYLTGAHESVVVADPSIRDASRDGLGGTVHHVRARFQDLEWHVNRAREYGLVILGLDLEGLTAEDEATLFGLVDAAKAVVIEFSTSWEPSREQYARIRTSTSVAERFRTAIDFGGNDFGDLTNSWPPRVERELHVLRPRGKAAVLARPDDGGDLFAEPWRRLLAGERDGWDAYGGTWSFHPGGVDVRCREEWASLEWPGGLTDLARGPCFSIELTVTGDADAAGISFGPYRDLLARGPGTHRIRVDVDGGANTWALSVDGHEQPSAWWSAAIAGAEDLLGGRLTLKARHAAGVRFGDLAIHECDGACRLSVVFTCRRFLQRMRLALRTWCEQDLPAGALEVLVVNPESPDGTAEHLAAAARASRRVQVKEIRVPPELATNKGTMINRGLVHARGACVWIADADCLFPPHAAREALRQAEAGPRHLYYLRRHHLSSAQTDALLAGRIDPVRDFDHLSATLPVGAPQDHAPWGYTQLIARSAATAIRYREDINHFAHSDECFVAECREHGYSPRALDGLCCLHLDHPFGWGGTSGFL